MREMLGINNSDFDLVIVEIFASDCVSYIASKLKLLLIYVTPIPTDRGICGAFRHREFLKSIDPHEYFYFARRSENVRSEINQNVWVHLPKNCQSFILDTERSDEYCIDFTMMCVFFICSVLDK